ncbi:hypothetical protein [Reyranella sp.]|uniref:hypothetical protein n=1 Tax=Reyranella sp. TaxID=1929291 RepID=UPI003BADB85B
MNRRALLLASPLLAAVGRAAIAQPLNQLPPFTTVTFPPGSHTSTLTGQIAPGGRAVYYVAGKAGQTLMVSVASPSPAVSFEVFGINATLAKAADGMALVTGRPLPDAGSKDDARAWIGALPQDGKYLILVRMPAGTGTSTPYDLVVTF